jgi:hypothetical protein
MIIKRWALIVSLCISSMGYGGLEVDCEIVKRADGAYTIHFQPMPPGKPFFVYTQKEPPADSALGQLHKILFPSLYSFEFDSKNLNYEKDKPQYGVSYNHYIDELTKEELEGLAKPQSALAQAASAVTSLVRRSTEDQMRADLVKKFSTFDEEISKVINDTHSPVGRITQRSVIEKETGQAEEVISEKVDIEKNSSFAKTIKRVWGPIGTLAAALGISMPALPQKAWYYRHRGKLLFGSGLALSGIVMLAASKYGRDLAMQQVGTVAAAASEKASAPTSSLINRLANRVGNWLGSHILRHAIVQLHELNTGQISTTPSTSIGTSLIRGAKDAVFSKVLSGIDIEKWKSWEPKL